MLLSRPMRDLLWIVAQHKYGCVEVVAARFVREAWQPYALAAKWAAAAELARTEPRQENR